MPRIYKNTDTDSEVLSQKCSEITTFDDKLNTLIEDMIATMQQAGGVGIAAPQVGEAIRLFVAKTSQGIKEFINPVITEQSDEYLAQEGCLSVPGYIGYVMRPKHISGYAFNKSVEKFNFNYSASDAHVVSHENDHLDGILYTQKAKRTVPIKAIKIIVPTIIGAGLVLALGLIILGIKLFK